LAIAALGGAALSPAVPSKNTPQQTSAPGPPIPKQRPESSNKPTKQQNHSESGNTSAVIPITPGASKDAPLYVSAAYDHGCGYAEDVKHWWERFWAEPANVFAGAVALFTLGLLISAVWQGCLIGAQIRLARQEFISTHRPELVVRRISLHDRDRSARVRVQWIVANIGASPGKIVESNATLRFYEGPLPAIPNYDNDTASMGNMEIHSGVSAPINKTFAFNAENWFSYFANEKDGGGPNGLYFFGYVLYEDGLKRLRHMAFCGRYDPKTERFVSVGDPNYEHEE
jgi:hypothetical protein